MEAPYIDAGELFGQKRGRGLRTRTLEAPGGCVDGGAWAGGACHCTCALGLLSSPQVDGILRQAMAAPGLAAMSALVIHNDTVLWTGNFGKKNGSDPTSGTPNEYTMYRSAGVRDGREEAPAETGRTERIMVGGGGVCVQPASTHFTDEKAKGANECRISPHRLELPD